MVRLTATGPGPRGRHDPGPGLVPRAAPDEGLVARPFAGGPDAALRAKPWNDDDMLVVINGAWIRSTSFCQTAADWHLAWDSAWAVPQPRTAPFSPRAPREPKPTGTPTPTSLNRRIRQGKDVKTVANGSAGWPAESHGLPPGPPGRHDVLEALALRIYFSGELLEALKAGSQTRQVGTVNER